MARVLFLLLLLPSPVNVCVFAGPYPSSVSRVRKLLEGLKFGKLTVVVVYSDFYGTVFPANLLKNVAISTVFTTHFIEVESSMLPSKELYSTLRNIPISVLYEPINLVVVPTFYAERYFWTSLSTLVTTWLCRISMLVCSLTNASRKIDSSWYSLLPASD